MKRADRRKYHYIYKTTCIVTDRYYIGMHSTDNLNDGYQGSGTVLSRSIKKHGKDKHQVEILEFLPDRKSLKKRESEIVNEEIVNDKMCMNLQLGGGGGFKNEEHRLKAQRSGGQAFSKRIKNDPEFRAKHIKTAMINLESARNGFKEYTKLNGGTFKGKKHTKETKEKISQKAKLRTGSKNSQYGTCWITNGVENRKIKRGDTFPNDWRLGRIMKV